MATKRVYNATTTYAAESDHGTAVSTTGSLGRNQVFQIDENQNYVPSKGLGSGRVQDDSLPGDYACSWNLEQEFHDPDFFGKFGIGTRSGSGTSGSPYLYTEVTGVGTVPFYTFEINSPDGGNLVDKLVSTVCRTWSLRGAKGQKVTMTMSGLAHKNVPGASPTGSYTKPTAASFMTHTGSVYWGATPSLIGQVQTWSITCDHGMTEDRDCSTRFNLGYSYGDLKYTFTLTVYVTDAAYVALKTSFNHGSTTALPDGLSPAPKTDELKIILSEGATTGKRTVTIWLDEAVIDQMSKPFRLGENLIQVTVTGHAHIGKSNQPLRWYTA